MLGTPGVTEQLDPAGADDGAAFIDEPAGAPDGLESVHRGTARRTRAGTALPALLTAFRRDLAGGAYLPRERLVEADLVARYGTTRAAVREALIQLTTEGLVERAPNRGARVRAMSVEEAIEIAEVRRLLEPLCAGRAAALGTAAERRRLGALAQSLEAAALTGHVDEYLGINVQFHAAIHAMARHTTAQEILQRFQHRPIDRFFPQPFRPSPPSTSVDEHQRVAAAILAGDAAAAEAAMHEHLTSLVEMLRHFQRRTRRT